MNLSGIRTVFSRDRLTSSTTDHLPQSIYLGRIFDVVQVGYIQLTHNPLITSAYSHLGKQTPPWLRRRQNVRKCDFDVNKILRE